MRIIVKRMTDYSTNIIDVTAPAKTDRCLQPSDKCGLEAMPDDI